MRETGDHGVCFFHLFFVDTTQTINKTTLSSRSPTHTAHQTIGAEFVGPTAVRDERRRWRLCRAAALDDHQQLLHFELQFGLAYRQRCMFSLRLCVFCLHNNHFADPCNHNLCFRMVWNRFDCLISCDLFFSLILVSVVFLGSSYWTDDQNVLVYGGSKSVLSS